MNLQTKYSPPLQEKTRQMETTNAKKKRVEKEGEGSSDSEWSEIANPGQSHLDELIKKRNRFNLHYHKSEIIQIPDTNRIPLLPNEENFDWIYERKLLSIEKNFRPYLPQEKKLQERQAELATEDPYIEKLKQEWDSLSQAEQNEINNRQSLNLLMASENIKAERTIPAFVGVVKFGENCRRKWKKVKKQQGQANDAQHRSKMLAYKSAISSSSSENSESEIFKDFHCSDSNDWFQDSIEIDNKQTL